MEGELAADAGPVEIDTARVRRPGSDLTLVTYSASLYKCLEAAVCSPWRASTAR